MPNPRPRQSPSGASFSDYVREVTAAREQTLALTPEEQLAFGNALAAAPSLTESQRRLGSLMQGGM